MGANQILIPAIDRDDRRPGTWHRREIVEVGTHRQGVNVFAYCPDCGRRCGIHSTFGRSHGIKADGTVHPSVVCPHSGCTYHEHVRLEGWTHGELPMHDGDG